MSTADRRARFRELHARDELFVMPNPWDLGSARLLAAEGFEALATTSQGFAWAIGKHDQTVTRDELVEHVATLAAATPLPLNVDSERCYPEEQEGSPSPFGSSPRPARRDSRSRTTTRRPTASTRSTTRCSGSARPPTPLTRAPSPSC